jgi:hypothetical protein
LVAYTTLMNGGTQIIGYNMQIDDGNNGEFTSIIGGADNSLDTNVLVTAGIAKGKIYRAKYRAINSIGAGAFSAITYIPAATAPI